MGADEEGILATLSAGRQSWLMPSLAVCAPRPPLLSLEKLPEGPSNRNLSQRRLKTAKCRHDRLGAPPPGEAQNQVCAFIQTAGFALRMVHDGGVRKGRTMSLDLFMNDSCPKCRKPIKLAAVGPHPNSRELAVHRFECSSCGRMTTKILYRKPDVAAA
jgi:hypothetical protein